MHMRSQEYQNLVPFDAGIEAAARRQGEEPRRKQRAEVAMAGRDNRVLQDYALPQTSAIASSIISPAVKANNSELSPTLISFVE